MPVRDFRIHIPNPGDGRSTATLTLEPVSEPELDALGYDLPAERLTVRAVRITSNAPASTLAGCLYAFRPFIVGIVDRLLGRTAPIQRHPLHIRLEPKSATDINVGFDAVGAKGVAAVRLIDRRDGVVVGGITMLVLAGISDAPPREVASENPCPIVVAQEAYWLALGSEPDETPPGGPIPPGFDLQFVVWVTNPTTEILDGAVAYLEHLGGSTVEFTPATFNLGALEPGDRYPLKWRIRSAGGAPGIWRASVVVASSGTSPVRLQTAYELAPLIPDEYVPVVVATPEPA